MSVRNCPQSSADFLDDGVYAEALDKKTTKLLNSNPLTNLAGERIFGDFDFDLNKRRHASLHLRSTLNMLKRNKSTAWLRKQSTSKVNHVLKVARKNFILKAQSREREKEARNKIKAKLQENYRLKKQKELKAMENTNIISEAVISQGGLCETKEDIDKLISTPNALQNIKSQIKYRKVILGENINFVCSISALYFRLCEHLGFAATSLPKRSRNRKVKTKTQ